MLPIAATRRVSLGEVEAAFTATLKEVDTTTLHTVTVLTVVSKLRC